jgi:hypothetical protein
MRYADEALEAAPRLGRPDELGIAVSAYLWSARVTDQMPLFRAVLDEMLTDRWRDLTPLAQGVVAGNQLHERLRFGDLARFDAEFEEAWHLATDVLHSPELQGQLGIMQGCRHLVCGDLERAAELVDSAFQSLQDLGTTWREPSLFIVDSCRMLLTATLADHAEQIAMRLVRPDP